MKLDVIVAAAGSALLAAAWLAAPAPTMPPAARAALAEKINRPPKPFDKPAEAALFFAAQRAPFGEPVPVERYVAARQWLAQRPAALRGAGPGGLQGWQEIGPGNVGGRTRAFAFHPDNPDVIFVGGVTGGIWKSVDAGQNWQVVDDMLPNIGITDIVFDPGDSDVLYAATGEGYYPVVNNPNTEDTFLRGNGIFQSVDGGATWNQIPATDTPDFHWVNEIIVSPANSQHLFAATSTGVWRSLNGGVTWGRRLAAQGNSLVGCLELAIRTDTDPPTVFAGMGSFLPDGLYRSTDNGRTFQKLTSGLPTAQQGRIEIAIAPGNQDIIYASIAENFNGTAGKLKGVYRSLDGGDTWAQRVNLDVTLHQSLLSNPLAGICLDEDYSQGWYDHALLVDPTDSDVVFLAGIDLFRSDDGGVTWGLASAWWQKPYLTPGGPNYCHADIHTLRLHPDYDGNLNQTMYVCSDGGVYRSDNVRAATTTAVCTWDPPSEVTFTNLNQSYGTIQFYHGAALGSPLRILGGAQDNGSLMTTDGALNNWAQVFGGDGGYCAIDPVMPNRLYVETQFFPNIRKSVDGGANFTSANEGIDDGGGLFIAPIAMDPVDSTRLWTGGTRAWRTKNRAINWVGVSPDFDPGFHISAIAIAPSQPRTVYLGFSDGYAYRSDDALGPAPTWTPIHPPRAGTAFLSWITVHPTDPLRAYATYSTFGGNKIYRTSDGGASWTNITGTPPNRIPDIPINTVAINPLDDRVLYAGTDLGVFVSLDDGVNWQPDTAGMPPVPVENFVWLDDQTLVAFTHGRGVLQTSVCLLPADTNGDGVVDLSDLATLLANFGSTEATSSQGDLDGDGDVDLSDLAALLAAFGQTC